MSIIIQQNFLASLVLEIHDHFLATEKLETLRILLSRELQSRHTNTLMHSCN